jgi:hypothetical protein
MYRSLSLIAALWLAVSACSRSNATAPSPLSPTTPTPTAPAPNTDRIEYVVQGANLLGPATIRFDDPLNGLTLTTSDLPYVATATNTDPSAFLYVEASGFGQFLQSTLQVQIFVNGRIFREGSSTGFTMFASASGTYQR